MGRFPQACRDEPPGLSSPQRVRARPLPQGSIGRTDFPRGDHATLLRSIRERIWPLGDDVTLLPGHGPATTVGEERAHNPFLQGAYG